MRERGRLKRIAGILVPWSVALATVVICLQVMRSAYAAGLFRNISNGLSEAGWQNAGSDSLMQVDEELTYEASYLIFKLGSVRFQVLRKTVYDSRPAYRLRAYIDSYGGFPFVSFHAAYETYADADSFTCLFSSRSEKEGDSWVYTTTNFDFKGRRIEWEELKDGKEIRQIGMPLDTSYTNGVSFFYYLRNACRLAAGRETRISVPIIDDTVRSRVNMTLNEALDSCRVEAVSFPLEAARLSGHIDFVGTFGVTGDFVGWISTDSSQIPLRANLKVLIGNIVVQLKNASRIDWLSPQVTRHE